MEITTRGLWTLLHGMGFGALYLLACSGALVELWRRYSTRSEGAVTAKRREISEDLSGGHGGVGLGDSAYRGLCHLSLVPRGCAAGNG